MFTFNDKEYRNLQEQVQENKEQIAQHWNVDRVLADFGITVLGRLDSVEDLPLSEDENWGYGYLIGQVDDPNGYTVYVWTRPNINAGQPNPYWLNIGKINIVGPQGPQGEQGPKGDKGDKGDRGPTGATGAQGPQGIKGAQGERGPQGPRGEQGPQGPAGVFNIKGTLSTSSLLPSASTMQPSDAYLVLEESGLAYDLYIITATDSSDSSTYTWQNTGLLGAGTTITVNGSAVSSWNADTKLDKVTSTDYASRVYAITASGTQTTFRTAKTVPESGATNSIPQYVSRTTASDGAVGTQVLLTGTPFYPAHATNKQYVDNAIRNIDPTTANLAKAWRYSNGDTLPTLESFTGPVLAVIETYTMIDANDEYGVGSVAFSANQLWYGDQPTIQVSMNLEVRFFYDSENDRLGIHFEDLYNGQEAEGVSYSLTLYN